METLEPRLETLLMSKSFRELNSSERGYVLTLLTEESYGAYHLILKHTAAAANDDALVPAAGIPTQLKSHFDAKRKPAQRLVLSVKHLSIAASLFLAVCLALVFFKTEQQAKPRSTAQQVKVKLPVAEVETVERPDDLPKKAIAQSPDRQAKAVLKVKSKPKVRALAEAGLLEKTDTILVVTEKFYGLRVQEPLLGLDIDVNDQFLGLRIPGNVN